MFRVVPDQLRISDGWVRCGQCNEVFDANANLHTELPVQALPEPVGVSGVPNPATDDDASELRVDSTAIREPSGAVDLSGPSSTEPQWEHEDPFLAQSPQELLHSEPSTETQAWDTVEMGKPEPEDLSTTVDSFQFETVAPRYVQSDSVVRSAPHGMNLSFMRGNGAASKWHRPWLRLGLVVVCAFLLLLLVLQVTVQERDRIAASTPASRPVLQALCSALACSLGPVRQIESIAIDSSSFTKVHADVYRLSFTLRNSAVIDIARPALELSLTDMQDQTVFRRVFAGAELGSRQDLIAAGSELTASVPISIKHAGGAEKVSGYRLLAFYP
jgi:predicted Zn finger-like uncharacterized protein